MFTRLRSLLAATAALLAPSSIALAQSPPIAGDWTLTFEDNFNGSTLSGEHWRVGQHWEGIAGTGGNSPEQISVSSGKLRMKSEQRSVVFSGNSYNYATGEISTFKTFRQQYGYFETRIKYPAVTGLWPAFWLMPDRGNYGWAGEYFRTMLKFDLTGVSPGTITSAQLVLRASDVEAGGNKNVLFMGSEDDSWTETGVTWNNMPTPNPLWLAQRYNAITAGSDVTVDVKDFVVEQMAGDKTMTFVLADTFMKTKRVTFHSREYGTASVRPRLIINGTTYYPSADAFVYKGNPDTNYGTTADLRVEDGWGGTSSTYDGGMEIDIMESLGIWGANVTSHALHWDGYGGDHQAWGSGELSYPATGDGYHTYGLYWEEDRVEFYVDGQLTATRTDSRIMSVPAYIILSLQLGGWDGNTAGAQVHNQVMEVDYVRVWSGTKAEPVGGGGTLTMSQGEVSAYHSGQDVGTGTVSGDGKAITIAGNVWKKVPLSYSVTTDTMLRFTVNATDTGEILAIGLDNNNDFADAQRGIQLAGSQTWTNYAFQLPPAERYTAGSGPATYEMPLGSYFTGAMNWLFFTGDDDGNASTNATFSNIEIFEAITFSAGTISSWSSSQDAGTGTPTADGLGVTIAGNVWKKIPYTYTVTPNTMLRFTVDANDAGEILGIGLDNDNEPTNAVRIVQLAGSQGWPAGAQQLPVAERYTPGSGPVEYVLPIGQYFTGAMNYLVFAGDDDGNGSTDATFTNIRVFED